MGTGPDFYRTFDGLEFYFAGRCQYTVYADTIRSVVVKMVGCKRFTTCRKVRISMVGNI